MKNPNDNDFNHFHPATVEPVKATPTNTLVSSLKKFDERQERKREEVECSEIWEV